MAKENAIWCKSKHNITSTVYQKMLITEDFETEKSDTKFEDIEIIETFDNKDMVLNVNGTYLKAKIGQWLITKGPGKISLVEEAQAIHYIPVATKK